MFITTLTTEGALFSTPILHNIFVFYFSFLFWFFINKKSVQICWGNCSSLPCRSSEAADFIQHFCFLFSLNHVYKQKSCANSFRPSRSSGAPWKSSALLFYFIALFLVMFQASPFFISMHCGSHAVHVLSQTSLFLFYGFRGLEVFISLITFH